MGSGVVMGCGVESDDVLREQAYLVARGVRPLALVGHCPDDEMTMLQVATAVERCAEAGTVPFVVDRGDGMADYGYAGSGWVVECYRWLVSTDGVPDQMRGRIRGLMLGYSVDAIRRFEDEGSGRLFNEPELKVSG